MDLSRGLGDVYKRQDLGIADCPENDDEIARAMVAA
jgi:hypothetical protein